MSTTELKKRLLEKIEEIDQDYLLQEVLNLIEFETTSEPIKLSSEQKSAVDQAREQIKNGEFFTNEEVDNEIDEWLNE